MMNVVRYDGSVDALYVDLDNLSPQKIHDTREVQPGVMVDYDVDGNIIGVEILGFQERLNAPASLPQSVEVPA